jgi:hypothetical protein
VGLKDRQAQQQGLKFKVKSENTPNWFTARRLAERVYGYKTPVQEGTGQILGAHIVGPQADEVINLLALASAKSAITGRESHSITSWAPELNDHRDGWFGRIRDHRVPAISEIARTVRDAPAVPRRYSPSSLSGVSGHPSPPITRVGHWMR